MTLSLPISSSLPLLPLQVHSLSPSQSRSQFSCSACDRSFTLLSSLLTHQHSHTPEQRLLAEAEAEIVCPASLSLSLPLPCSPSQGDQHQDTQGDIHVSLMAVTEEGDREVVKTSTRAVVKGQRRGAASKTAGGNNGELVFFFWHFDRKYF